MLVNSHCWHKSQELFDKKQKKYIKRVTFAYACQTLTKILDCLQVIKKFIILSFLLIAASVPRFYDNPQKINLPESAKGAEVYIYKTIRLKKHRSSITGLN